MKKAMELLSAHLWCVWCKCKCRWGEGGKRGRERKGEEEEGQEEAASGKEREGEEAGREDETGKAKLTLRFVRFS